MSFCTISSAFYADNLKIMQIFHNPAVISIWGTTTINCTISGGKRSENRFFLQLIVSLQKRFELSAMESRGEYTLSLEEKHISFVYDDTVCKYIANKCANTKTGAREIRNIIRREIENKLVDFIINDNNISGISATISDDKLKVTSI